MSQSVQLSNGVRHQWLTQSAQLRQRHRIRKSEPSSRRARRRLSTTCRIRWLARPKGLKIIMLRRGESGKLEPIVKGETTRSITRSKNLKIPMPVVLSQSDVENLCSKTRTSSFDRIDQLCHRMLFLGRSEADRPRPRSTAIAQQPKEIAWPSPRKHALLHIPGLTKHFRAATYTSTAGPEDHSCPQPVTGAVAVRYLGADNWRRPT
jgi:hypothetical protein